MTEVFSFNIFIKKSCGEYFNLFAPLTASWQQFTHKHLWSCVLTAQELILIRLVFCILFRFILSLNIKLIAISEWIFPFKLITRLYMDFIKSFDLMQLMFLTKYDKLFSKLYTADFHKTLWHPKKKIHNHVSYIRTLSSSLLSFGMVTQAHNSWIWPTVSNTSKCLSQILHHRYLKCLPFLCKATFSRNV